MMMMAMMLYTFENLFSIFWNRMIYEKWIEWSNSKDFCVKCQDFLQSKHNVSILLCIYYPGKLPFSLKTFIRYECSHLVSINLYLTKPPGSLLLMNEKVDREIDSPSWWCKTLGAENAFSKWSMKSNKVPTSEILKFLLCS